MKGVPIGAVRNPNQNRLVTPFQDDRSQNGRGPLQRRSTGTPSYDRLIAISDALRIDRLRAQVALEVIGCAKSYYSPGTALMSRLIPRLTDTIARPDCELDEELNSWQTEAIINQAEQAVCKGLETNKQIKQRFLSLGR